jgi:hypothetical protein
VTLNPFLGELEKYCHINFILKNIYQKAHFSLFYKGFWGVKFMKIKHPNGKILTGNAVRFYVKDY